MSVGLVFVSHSADIASGLVDVARQMAPTVRLFGAGGTDDDGIGTSAGKVERAIAAASGGDGVVVIGDLGSAILTAETVVDLLDEQPAGGVRVIDVPLVEGGVAAAVAAESGAGVDDVVRAAAGKAPSAPEAAAGPRTRTVVLTDPDGLHARPAALVVREAGRFDATVAVGGANARSLLAILALGLRQGASVEVAASGPDADAALASIAALLSGSDAA